MPYALYFNGEKIKEAESLPTIDQSFPVMQDGYEWRTIVEDPDPDHNPVYEVVTVTEAKQTGKKLKKTKAKAERPNWQALAREVVLRKISEYTRWDLVARDLIKGENGPNKVRALAAVAHADALLSQIDAGTKPDLDAGWPS